MPLLFSLVGRGTTTLAKYAAFAGNFSEIVEQVLPKVPQDGDTKLTFAYGQYFFHVITANNVIYMCIADDEIERSRAFSFLNDVKNRFEATYGQRAQTALPYAMNSDFSIVLCNQMKAHFDPARRNEKIEMAQNQVEDLKSVMVKNIDMLVHRGERLELLIDRSASLESGAVAFRESGRKISSRLWWKNAKYTVAFVFTVLLLVFIIITASCGGFDYKSCR